MEERNNSDEITFHLYVDAVIEQKIPWHTFTKWTKDFYNSDMGRLKHLNAMILMKLTVSYSDMERSTYLNAILLRELKKSILKMNMSEEESEHEAFQDAKTAAPNDNESEEKFDANNDFKNNLSNEEECMSLHTNIEVDDNYEQTIQENEIQVVPRTKETSSSENNTLAEYNQTKIIINKSKTFNCSICNKDFRIYFHLKQHIKKVHDNNTKYRADDIENNSSNEKKINLTSFTHSGALNMYTLTVHEGTKIHRCEYCGKSFTGKTYLKH